MTAQQGNQAVLVGYMVEEDFEFSHKVNNEKFFKFTLEIERMSGTKDYLPIIISEKLIDNRQTYADNPVCVIGEFRSYNQKDESSTHLLLYVFAQEFYFTDDKTMNELYINGFVCRPPLYRTTPLGRQIADLMLAVPRAYGKCDYIPCICWGRNAVYASQLGVGSNITVSGRIQSREYQKEVNAIPITKIAYEVSVCDLKGA